MALTRIMGGQWRMALRHIIDMRCRSAAERLGAFLLKYYDYSETRPVELPFTKATLAARLGISRETLSRMIQVVAANGGLAELSLEQLADLPVTSVSGRPESLRTAPASVFVISGEDIRRSGAPNLPEALRLAPNLQVARLSAAQYAISARGFNNAIGNKLLVLIDGRTVYSSLFSGVFWDVQDTLLEDIERVEVVRGPGATLWGANAVNGVIDIISKPAAETQGGLVRVVGGTDPQLQASVRYGGRVDADTHYRVYAKATHSGRSRLADGGDGRCSWNAPRPLPVTRPNVQCTMCSCGMRSS